MFTRAILEYHDYSYQPTAAVQTRGNRNFKLKYLVYKEYLIIERARSIDKVQWRPRLSSFVFIAVAYAVRV